jgi:uncharacterized protein (TIGR03437 family)
MNRRFVPCLAVFFCPNVAALAQPVISTEVPAVSSASYRTPGMAGSGIAQGSIFTIFGTGLGPPQGVQAFTFPLPTKLGGASVTVTVGSTQVSAIVLFSYSTQLNAILPSTTPVGSGAFTVTYNGQTSAPAPIQVVASAFGTYTYNSSGSGQAIATDVTYQLNTIIHTLHPGDYGILWGTGLGAIGGDDSIPPPTGNLPGSINVYVGNSAATTIYQGRSGCCAGLDQIVFQVPAGVTGCYVPIAVQAGGAVANIATIAVSASGQTCSDSVMGQDLVNKLASGQTVHFGYVRLESLIATFIPGSTFFASSDAGMATFSEYTPGAAGLAEYGVSSGYCVTVSCSSAAGCAVNSYNASVSDSSPAQLNAGSLSVIWGSPIALAQLGAGGFYGAQLLEPDGTRYLWSGLTYEVTGSGGAAVGVFDISDLTSVPGVKFSVLRSGDSVPLSGDVTLQWTGGDPNLQNGQVTIGGYSSADATYKQFEWLQCTAPLAAQKFTIPGWVLSTLPPSGTGQAGSIPYPLGWIWIGQYNNPTTFNSTGLDRGIVTDIFYNGLGVYFK